MPPSTTSAPPALVVGTGFGCRIHIPALRAAGFDVVGLVGNTTERTERRAKASNVPLAFTDLDEAIDKTGAVAVTIATPPHTHAALTLRAISHGCHVICEKPMASNADEAQAMLEAAERAGVTHLLGNEFRWQADRAIITRALADGLIGEPRFLTLISYLSLLAAPDSKMPRWWFNQTAGGGWLGAQGSHIVDQVRTWLGDFNSVSASLPIVSDRSGVAEDSYVVRFELTNGLQGVLQQTAAAWGPSTAMTRIAGTQGTLWAENGIVNLANSNGVRQLPVPKDLLLPPPPELNKDPRHMFSHLELGPYIRLCEVLRAGVEGNALKSAVPPPTFHDGLACTKVLDAIRQSASEDGSLVKL